MRQHVSPRLPSASQLVFFGSSNSMILHDMSGGHMIDCRFKVLGSEMSNGGHDWQTLLVHILRTACEEKGKQVTNRVQGRPPVLHPAMQSVGDLLQVAIQTLLASFHQQLPHALVFFFAKLISSQLLPRGLQVSPAKPLRP